MAQFALADELGALLGRTLESQEAAQADVLLQLASAAIQAEAGGQALEFVPDDEAELVGNWLWTLWLPQRPVTDVTAIVVTDPYGGTADTVELSQVVWTRRGRVRRNKGWCWNHSYWGGDEAVVRVTYSHGYETIPDDIKGVCLSAAARAVLSSAFSALPAGVTSETTDGYAVTYDAADRSATTATLSTVTLTEEECRLVRRYRPVNA